MADNLELHIRSGNPAIFIETTDEARAVSLLGKTAKSLRRMLYEWSVTDGLRRLSARPEEREVLVEPGSAKKVLEFIRSSADRSIYLLKDLGLHFKDGYIYRLFRDLLSVCHATKSTMILLDAESLPQEVRRFCVRYDLSWPTAEELHKIVRKTFQKIRDESYYEVVAKISKREMEQVVQTLRGLSCEEVERVIASAIHDDYVLDSADLPRIVEAKRELLGATGCLESIAADFAPSDIGGLKNLKAWLRQRRGGFSRRAVEFGLDPPRGVLMLGVPGCGKSLCAKVVAADWNMPLLRLDPGVLYQKFIGESESQLRQALAQAEAMAPVVLWVDEIEKAFASASTSSVDGGLSQRMFGTLLSWMQDHRHPIFIIATANDISALPPELMRKGRFDEVFFVDLPSRTAREQILAIHLRRRNRDPKKFELKRLAEATEGFGGSELEQAIVSALFTAFLNDDDLQEAYILDEIRKTRPLSVLQAERIAELRRWAEDRCVPAD